MKKLLGLILTLLALLGACTPHPYPPSLQTADSLASACPDSALALLASLKDEMNSAPEATRMYYRLLCVKAGDKAYVTHTSDSVIRSVLHYYIGKNDRRHLPEAYYYAGRVYRDLGDAPQALDCFQEATELLEVSNDYRLLKVIYSQMGRLFLYQDVYEEALKAFKRSYTYQVLAGDKKGMILDLDHIGTAFMALNNADSALIYYHKAYKLASEFGEERFVNLTLTSLSDLYIQLGQYDQAQHMLQAFNSLELQSPMATYVMASLYLHKGEIDSASYYYRKLLCFGDINSKQYAHWGLAEIADKRSDSRLALEHLRQYNAYTDSIHKITHTADIRKMQSLYNYQLQEKENLRLTKEVVRQRHYKNIAIFVLLLLTFAFTAYYMLRKYRKFIRIHQHKEFVRLQMEQYRKTDMFIEKNKEKAQLLDEEIRKTSDPIQQSLFQARKASLLSLNNQIETERKEQTLADTALRQSAIYVKFISAASETCPKLTYSDWEALRLEIDCCYANFINHLYSYYSFSEIELNICLLLKIGINVTGIARLTNRSKSAIVSARKSMYRKVYHAEGKPEQWDAFIRSL